MQLHEKLFPMHRAVERMLVLRRTVAPCAEDRLRFFHISREEQQVNVTGAAQLRPGITRGGGAALQNHAGKRRERLEHRLLLTKKLLVIPHGGEHLLPPEGGCLLGEGGSLPLRQAVIDQQMNAVAGGLFKNALPVRIRRQRRILSKKRAAQEGQ